MLKVIKSSTNRRTAKVLWNNAAKERLNSDREGQLKWKNKLAKTQQMDIQILTSTYGTVMKQ